MLTVLGKAGLGLPRTAPAHIHQPGKVKGKPSITIVRDPADWLRAVYQERLGPTNVPEIDELLLLKRSHQDYLQNRQPLEFEAFIEKYLAEMPGRVAKIFGLYKSDYEIPIENLPDGLIDALDAIGAPFGRYGILGTEPMNVNRAKLQWPDGLLEKVQKAEKPRRRRKKSAK
jgi:hypothetical protein